MSHAHEDAREHAHAGGEETVGRPPSRPLGLPRRRWDMLVTAGDAVEAVLGLLRVDDLLRVASVPPDAAAISEDLERTLLAA